MSKKRSRGKHNARRTNTTTNRTPKASKFGPGWTVASLVDGYTGLPLATIHYAGKLTPEEELGILAAVLEVLPELSKERLAQGPFTLTWPIRDAGQDS